MKPTILMERFPYRFMETKKRGWIEKYNIHTKRYAHMYEVDSERQMATLLEDSSYVLWLDPKNPPCYTRNAVSNPYPKS